jgi:sugar lactone lactonase YvrE
LSRPWTLSLAAAILLGLALPLRGASFYSVRPDDSKAVYLTREHFAVHADGVGDDAPALQAAIDRVEETSRKGVVFVPQGNYRLSRTVYVWNGIRLIGYGSQRPVFILGENTPGYQDGTGKYLIHFVSDRPAAGRPIRDANPGTFYSAMANIDVELRDGNPAAIGVRFHVAQHCYLAHINFRIGCGRAGIEDIGNEAEDCHFFGGDYGILTRKPSPSWPFLLIDSSFTGQRKAAIETEEAGLTLVRVHFEGAPTAISIREHRAEELWLKDSHFKDITGPAVLISEENSARTEINFERVVCEHVPLLAAFRESGKRLVAPSSQYLVKRFSHGLHLEGLGRTPEIKTICQTEVLRLVPEPASSDIPGLPDTGSWVNIRLLGAKGDGFTDDTEAFRQAVARHRTLYLPTGRYRLSDTLALRPDTVLVGLSPVATQLVLADATAGFQGVGPPKALLEAPAGGSNIVTGIGLDTGGINPRAVGAKWMAGSRSLMNDVRFVGGHGTYTPEGEAVSIYNQDHTGDADPRRRWDSQFPSLWVTAGGGGTFKDIWTPSPFAQAGLVVSDTATEGRVYALSSEHHLRNEVKLRNVSHWRFYALQVEEERGEGPNALPLDIEGCTDLTFGNLYLYRVMSTYSPFPHAVRVRSSANLRFRNVHVYSPSKFAFDETLYDQTHAVGVRSREIAALDLSGQPPTRRPTPAPAVLARGTGVEKLAGGFNNIDSLTVDAAGDVYFVDARWHRIYRWSVPRRELSLVRDEPLDPVGLTFDESNHLQVVTRTGTVYSFRPDRPTDPIQVLEPTNLTAGKLDGRTPNAMRMILPLNRWRDAHDFFEAVQAPAACCYFSPDGSTAIAASKDFPRAGPMRSFYATIDLIRACGLAVATPGRPFYVADEFGQKTWAFEVGLDGSLTNPRLFVEEGEAGTAVDTAGNVYVAAGHVFVYTPSGKPMGVLEVPERPTSLAFGGQDRRTLFVGARSSLYAVRTRLAGR